MPITLSLRTDEVRASVKLPHSKSVWNRALMINAYAGMPLLDSCEQMPSDVKQMREAIETVRSGQTTVDSGEAGTVARFVMTWLAMTPGCRVMTGSQRMLQRPIAPLVEALRGLGASIEYLDKDDFLPVRIEGGLIQGGEVSLTSTMSSQYASSLLLAAPMWPKGLVLHLPDKMPSLPYVDMTLAVMRRFGAIARREGNVVVVQHQPYHDVGMFQIPADWSAASYWYEIAALSKDCDIFLQGLELGDERLEDSGFQGDSIAAQLFKPFGILTNHEANGVRLRKSSRTESCEAMLHFDVSLCPDLFPSLYVTCVALRRPAVFSGIKNLSLKESDRVEALTTELSKYYTFINIISDDEIKIFDIMIKCNTNQQDKPFLETYNDHRVAMSLAPLILQQSILPMNHPEVVEKSYPSYWSDIQSFAYF